MLKLNYNIHPQSRCFFSIFVTFFPYFKIALKSSVFPLTSVQIEMVPQNYQKLESEEHISLMEKLLDIMEDDNDVQNVWHNWEQE